MFSARAISGAEAPINQQGISREMGEENKAAGQYVQGSRCGNELPAGDGASCPREPSSREEGIEAQVTEAAGRERYD